MAEEHSGGGGTIDVPGVGPTKKVYVYAAGALLIGVLGYAWFSYKGKGSADLAGGADPATDYIGGDTGATTTPGITPTTPTTETPDPDSLPPTTNEEWTRRAEEWLTETLGYDSQMIGVVFGKYFSRQGLTPTEQDLVRSAWARFGRPPVGDWPILSVPTPPPPPPPPPPPSTTPPPTTTPPPAARTYTVKSGDNLWNIENALHLSHGTLYRLNSAAIEADAKRHGHSSSDNGHWIFPGLVLHY